MEKITIKDNLLIDGVLLCLATFVLCMKVDDWSLVIAAIAIVAAIGIWFLPDESINKTNKKERK